MAELHDDEILSAALDGEPDALRAIESRSDLRARLEDMDQARQLVRGHRFEVPDEVREANVSAALAAFDEQLGVTSIEAGYQGDEAAAVTPISRARSAKRTSRAPFAIGSAAAVVVAAVVGFSMLRGGDALDTASDSATDASTTELSDAASSAPAGSADDALAPEQGLALDEAGAAGADAQMATTADDTGEVAKVESADGDSEDAPERAGGTATTAALVPLGPVPDQFERCIEALDIPVRPWIGGAVEPRVDGTGADYVFVTVVDDTGVAFSVGFVAESCELI